MIDPKDIKKAVSLVLEKKMKIRAAAERYNLKKSTLFFHVKKVKNKTSKADESGIEDSSDTEAGETKSKHASRQIFSSQEERSLAQYFCHASVMRPSPLVQHGTENSLVFLGLSEDPNENDDELFNFEDKYFSAITKAQSLLDCPVSTPINQSLEIEVSPITFVKPLPTSLSPQCLVQTMRKSRSMEDEENNEKEMRKVSLAAVQSENKERKSLQAISKTQQEVLSRSNSDKKKLAKRRKTENMEEMSEHSIPEGNEELESSECHASLESIKKRKQAKRITAKVNSRPRKTIKVVGSRIMNQESSKDPQQKFVLFGMMKYASVQYNYCALMLAAFFIDLKYCLYFFFITTSSLRR